MSDVEHFALIVLIIAAAVVAAVLSNRISERPSRTFSRTQSVRAHWPLGSTIIRHPASRVECFASGSSIVPSSSFTSVSTTAT